MTKGKRPSMSKTNQAGLVQKSRKQGDLTRKSSRMAKKGREEIRGKRTV